MLFNLVFAKNVISTWFLFFFLIIDLYVLIPAVIAQSFNPIAELIISVGMPTKKEKQKLIYSKYL